MLDIGFQELLVLMVIALLVFGPDKLPELGRRLGRAMREFRRASDEFRSTVESNLRINEDLPLPRSASDLATASAGENAGGGAGEEVGLEPTQVPVPTSDPLSAGAPAHPGNDAFPETPKPAGEPVEPFWTRRGGRLLHRSACGWKARVPEAERVALKAATDGWDLGLEPCPVCDPRALEVPS